MNKNRREFLATSGVAIGSIALLPYGAMADGHESHVFPTPRGNVTVHPVNHAAFVMETPVGTIYNDPIGDAAAYANLPAPDLILITHHHGDHFQLETLAAIATPNTRFITNPNVFDKLPDDMKTKAQKIANGETASFNGVSVEAIPAYNLAEERQAFHPKGRDNGYVVNLDGLKAYISGDTEDTPEMRALTDIDLAFLCMNLPFTMDVKAAASAVAEFKPKYVFPYHYRGRGGGTQDPAEFAKLVGDAASVKMDAWYS